MSSHSWKEFFYLPLKDRWITLSIILIINAVSLTGFLYYSNESNQISIQIYQEENIEKNKLGNNKKIVDVNKIDHNAWMNLGFSEKQAKMICNYRKQIGGFKNEASLLNVFCIDSVFISRKDIHLIFTSSMSMDSKYTYGKTEESDSNLLHGLISTKEKIELPEKVSVIIELNTANKSELENLPGIGVVLSERIIKYRDLLGGYRSINQIREVYGMSEKNFNRFYTFLKINGEVKKINLNNTDFKELIRHPYLDKNHVKAILNFKKQHGEFQSIEQLNEIYSIPDSIFVKIRPYLKIEE
ncbi:MAG: helix-hairpin-helix domain-containing protein [Crocinitomicaceae bacterium]